MEVLPRAIFLVELPNQHRILAHIGKWDRDMATSLEAGQAVMVEMSPYDFSQGRILRRASKNL